MGRFDTGSEEYDTYKLEVAKWEQKTGNKIKENTFKEKLQQKQQEVQEKEANRIKNNFKYDKNNRLDYRR